MGELRNCPECDRLFVYVGRNLCPQCIEKEEEEFTIIRRYVREHPGASVFEVAEATGVEESRILDFLREGRLVSQRLADSAVFQCERCGTHIKTGRFCQLCAAEIEDALSRSIKGFKPQDQPPADTAPTRGRERMHIKEKESPKRGKPGG